MAGACCGWIGGAKAAEAAKAYNVDGDDDEGHEDDPEPIMRELDEALIAQEEAKGREQMADKYAPKKVAVKAENKSWRPPEEVREIERQRKATERDENRAARAARSSGGSNVRRVKIPAGSYAQKWSAMSAGAKKRTEVDLTMEELQSTTGGLRSKDAVSHCVQLFNLCYPVDADGVTQINTRDLGLILEARTRRRRRHVVLSKVHQRPRRSDCVRGARRASAQDFENLDGFDASFQRVCHHSHR